MSGPKIESERIVALVNALEFRTHRVPGTNVTLATAYLPATNPDTDGFVVGNGQSGCISNENFNEQTGNTIAIRNARADAVNNLWKLEGYVLWNTLQPT